MKQINNRISDGAGIKLDSLAKKFESQRVALEILIKDAYENTANTKPPVYELCDDLLDSVPENYREQDLDWLADAIKIRRHQIMVRRLKSAGVKARAWFRPGETDWFPSYVLVYSPVDGLPNTWATLDECRWLLDTVRNLSVGEAYTRWITKVAREEQETYTRRDAIHDTREMRAQLRRDLKGGKFDSRDYADLYRSTSFMDLVEE